jgi:hypothetical protein
LPGGGGADGARPEAGARAVAYGCVEGDAEDTDVVVFGGGGEAFEVREVGECRDARETPLDELGHVSPALSTCLPNG